MIFICLILGVSCSDAGQAEDGGSEEDRPRLLQKGSTHIKGTCSGGTVEIGRQWQWMLVAPWRVSRQRVSRRCSDAAVGIHRVHCRGRLMTLAIKLGLIKGGTRRCLRIGILWWWLVVLILWVF